MRLDLALISLPASLAHRSANIQAMDDACREAAKGGAQLAVFPELSITGYENAKRAYERAMPSEEARKICHAMAQKHGLAVMAGFVEQEKESHFLSHILVREDGSMGVYRKTHLAPPEQPLFKPGVSLPLFELNGFKIGVLLCYDAHFPLAFHHMAAGGADVILIPHASPRGTSQEKLTSWMRHLPARAFDNSVWIAALNPSGTNEAGLTFPPLAFSVNPSGYMEGEPLLCEGIYHTTITKDALRTVRSHPMRYFFPNTRVW